MLILALVAAAGHAGETLNYTAHVEVAVDATGEVTSVAVNHRVPEGLRAHIEQAARDWNFAPAMKDGRPVSSTNTIWVTYQMTERDDGDYEVRLHNLGDGFYPLERVPPTYPRRAARRRIEGEVDMEFTINRAGRVSDIEVIHSEPAGVFDRAATEALRQWRFKVVEVDGEPVETRATQTIRFELRSAND